MRDVVAWLIVAVVVVFIGGCLFQPHSVEAGHEGVVIDKPYFVGHEGVRESSVGTGRTWLWFSSDLVEYDIRPQQFSESFNDLVTLDNVPISLNAYLLVQVMPGQTPTLHERFGPSWYETKVQEVFRTSVRDFARANKLFDLTTNPAVTGAGEQSIAAYVRSYFKEEALPMQVNKVVIGRATPPKEVLDETARTAAQEQRIKTEIARARAELSRLDAEKNKAAADRGYANNFGMNPEQFLKYRALEIQKEMVEVVKDKQNVHVIVSSDPAVPMFNVK